MHPQLAVRVTSSTLAQAPHLAVLALDEGHAPYPSVSMPTLIPYCPAFDRNQPQKLTLEEGVSLDSSHLAMAHYFSIALCFTLPLMHNSTVHVPLRTRTRTFRP